MESNRKKFKRTKSLTLNKKGHRYYAKSQNISQTLSSPRELTEPTSHEIPSDNFASQPAAIVSESASSNRKKIPAPATTKYNQTSYTSNFSRRKSTKSVSTETITHCDKNIQTDSENMFPFRSPLCDSNFLQQFLEKLHSANQLEDFNKLATHLCDGRIPHENLAWKSALQIGRYFSCSTTTLMRYDPECVEFYACLYMLFGNSVLNVLRGPGHFSDVVTQSCGKGKFDPTTSKVNFAVPSLRVLQNVNTTYPKTIRPGLINYTLDCAQKDASEGKQFVLSFDGKKIAQGVSGSDKGDVNLWGNEIPPVLGEKLNLEKALTSCSVLSNKITQFPKDAKHSTKEQHIKNIQKVAKINSLRLKRLRKREFGEHLLERKLLRLKANNPDKKSNYEYALSFVVANTYKLQSCSRRALQFNLDLFKLLANLNNVRHWIPETQHVFLQNQPNYFSLLPPERLSHLLDLEDRNHFRSVKQRSDEWYNLRKKSRLTGSTMYKALGLDTLRAQKEHFDVYVKGKQPKPILPQVQEMMNYGTENEINAIATLVGLILPALRPPCFSVYELGCFSISGHHTEHLLVVSPDGLAQCSQIENCEYRESHSQTHNKLGIEYKCIFQSETSPNYPSYELPVRHVPQVLCTMAVLECTQLLLVTFTPSSVSVIIIDFDQVLWNKLFSKACELFDKPNPPIPTKVDPAIKLLRSELVEFIQTKSRFLFEVPSFRGSIVQQIPRTIISAYCTTVPKTLRTCDLKAAQRESKICSENGKELFQSIYDNLRQEATEVIVFMLSDKDRIYDPKKVNTAPVAYALKGPSMANSDLKKLVNKTRNALKERDIPVLAEVYDGQWQNFVMTDSENFPLTRMRLQNKSWTRISKLTKTRVIKEMLNTCSVSLQDKATLQTTRISRNGLMLQNIYCRRKRSGGILIHSLGGDLFDGLVSHLFTTCSDIEVWGNYLLKRTNEQKKQNALEANRQDELNTQEPSGRRKNSDMKCGLEPEETNLLSLLPQNIADNLALQYETDENIADTDNNETNLYKVLTAANFNLLNDIKSDLAEYNPRKWTQTKLDLLYPEILRNPQALNKECTAKELHIIAKILQVFTGRKFYSPSIGKGANVNMLSKAFEGDDFISEVKRKFKRAVRNPISLTTQCRNFLMHSSYADTALQVSYAEVCHIVNKTKWDSKCKIDMHVKVPFTGVANVNQVTMDLFCFPEFNTKRNQFEPRLLDYSHILTNMRTHICKTGGYDFCPTEHFRELARDRDDILSICSVYKCPDAQNVFTAERFFSEPVENWMTRRGYTVTAYFVRLTRNWHHACNKRGLSADTRVQHLYTMHRFLTAGINFDQFPGKCSERYIRGMPAQTFEAILQCISTRIFLYNFSLEKNYNTRSVSTLANESFFSDLTRMDRNGRNYPKACNIENIMGRVVTLNYFKHKPEKHFHLTTTTHGTYPVHHLESDAQDLVRHKSQNLECAFKNNFFDYEDTHKSHRVRKTDISKGNAPQRCDSGVRQYFRINEAKILPEFRHGLLPKQYHT